MQIYEISNDTVECAMVTLGRRQRALTVYVLSADPFSLACAERLDFQGATAIQVLLEPQESLKLVKWHFESSQETPCTEDKRQDVEKMVAYYLSKLWHMQGLLHHPDTFSAPELHLMEKSSSHSLIDQMAAVHRV